RPGGGNGHREKPRLPFSYVRACGQTAGSSRAVITAHVTPEQSPRGPKKPTGEGLGRLAVVGARNRINRGYGCQTYRAVQRAPGKASAGATSVDPSLAFP